MGDVILAKAELELILRNVESQVSRIKNIVLCVNCEWLLPRWSRRSLWGRRRWTTFWRISRWWRRTCTCARRRRCSVGWFWSTENRNTSCCQNLKMNRNGIPKSHSENQVTGSFEKKRQGVKRSTSLPATLRLWVRFVPLLTTFPRNHELC